MLNFNLILSALLQCTVSGPVFGFAIDSMLPRKKNAPSKLVRVGIWCIFCFAQALYQIFWRDLTQTTNYVAFVLSSIAAGISFRFCYAGKLLYKLLAFVILCICLSSAELVCGILQWTGVVSALSVDFTQPDMLLLSFCGAVASCACIFSAVGLWRHFKLNFEMPRGSCFLVLTSFCLFIPTMLYCTDAYSGTGVLSPLHLLSMGGATLVNFLMVCFQFNQVEKEQMEKELLLLKHKTELEQQHYQRIEQRREEMAKIRHDYNNLLASVLGLLHQNKVDEAKAVIQELVKKIEQTREYPYCPIPIINAVLSQKQEQCRNAHITMMLDLVLPESLNIASVDLCSIFANLMDNAIRACGKLPESTGRTIEIRGKTQGDYVLIRCNNPAAPKTDKCPDGTGYGSKILQDIANRYHGDFQTEYKNGIFSAKLILQNPQ